MPGRRSDQSRLLEVIVEHVLYYSDSGSKASDSKANALLSLDKDGDGIVIVIVKPMLC